MRKDMAKVIVERPRRGNPKRARIGRTAPLKDADDAPLRARAPVRKQQKTKSLNENLAPLKRYLEGQVGRPWSKVYSEIAEHLKPTSTVQQHVRDHVEDFVATKSRMQNGKVILLANRFGGESPLEQDYRKLYVHPRTGLLRRNDKAVSWKQSRRLRIEATAAELATRMRVIGPDEQLHLLKDGAWWLVRLAKIKRRKVSMMNEQGRAFERMIEQPHEDVVLRARLSDLDPVTLYSRYGVYAAEKRQLSKAEMKRLGLR